MNVENGPGRLSMREACVIYKRGMQASTLEAAQVE